MPTVLASAVLTTAGVTGNALAALTDGSGNGAVALTADLAASAAADGTLLISGTAPHVLGAPDADLIVLPVAEGSGSVWVAVEADSLQITAADGLDLTRAVGSVAAREVIVPADRQLRRLGDSSVAAIAAALLGAEAVGIANSAVQTAAGYAKLRHQFGRPIGQFQAVKHRCARMLVAAEQAAAVVWDAAVHSTRPPAKRPAAVSPRRRPRRWRPAPRCCVPTSASRCWVASAIPGSTRRTCTTAAQ